MDFNLKSLPWVENICQKFENMCLGVGEMVCKEVKHVEDQVQTVGANVKKFYSVVLPDIILPPSSKSPEATNGDACAGADPVEDNPSDEDSEKIASTGKVSPSISISDEICNESPPSSTSTGGEAGIESSCDGNSSLSHKECITDTNEDNSEDKMPTPKFSKETSSWVVADESGFCGFDTPLGESDDGEICLKSGKNGLEIPTHEKLPAPDVAEVAGSEECPSQDFSCNSLLEENEAKVDDKPEGVEDVPSSVSSEEGARNAALMDSLECLECEPSRFLGDDTESTAVTDLPEGVADLVNSGLSYESKTNDSGLPPSSNISSTKNNEDGSAELVRCNICFEPVVNMNEFEDVKLGDSCMVVDSKEIPLISSRARRCKSYKKKIRDVLASKSRKLREYKQLSILHSDLDTAVTEIRIEASIPSMLTKHVFSMDDSCESDWELL